MNSAFERTTEAVSAELVQSSQKVAPTLSERSVPLLTGVNVGNEQIIQSAIAANRSET